MAIIERAGLIDIELGPKVDTFGGAPGEEKARAFGTFGVPMRGKRSGR
jgi:hypothetical protein